MKGSKRFVFGWRLGVSLPNAALTVDECSDNIGGNEDIGFGVELRFFASLRYLLLKVTSVGIQL